MSIIRFFVFILLMFFVGCKQSTSNILMLDQAKRSECDSFKKSVEDKVVLDDSLVLAAGKDAMINTHSVIREALLLTKFKSFDELKQVIRIEYVKQEKPLVRITHCSKGREVTSVLKSGISEKDFMKARAGGFWDKFSLLLNSPYAVFNRKKMLKVYYLARRMDDKFGAGDPAFYDLAETTMANISREDLVFVNERDLTEKGYINTFNHITAQVFMTSLFSEKLADFIADSHERAAMPELITGEFTEEQITDLKNGPIDNYVDIINNEWGQELGKLLKKKYDISEQTYWTPELLTNYLNDIQRYYSWAFQMGFKPYREEDEVVVKFSNKLNVVVGELYKLW